MTTEKKLGYFLTTLKVFNIEKGLDHFVETLKDFNFGKRIHHILMILFKIATLWNAGEQPFLKSAYHITFMIN